MGLLERALQYKQRINETGKETLIDRIKGPAEAESARVMNVEKINISEIDQINHQAADTSADSKNEETSIENHNSDKFESNVKEEDIVLFNEVDFNSNDLKKAVTVPLSKPVETNEGSETVSIEKPDSENEEMESIVEIPDYINDENLTESEIPEFNDYCTLFEIQKEFIKADTVQDIYSTILFSIMGQLGVSSVSIIAPSVDNAGKWIITDSHGIKISDNDLYWTIDEGILQVLNMHKSVLDIEDLKNDINLRDDYYKFIAVDARIVAPLVKNDILAGAILVGEKINSEEFTLTEIDFLQTLSEIGSSQVESLFKFEKVTEELIGLKVEKEILSDVDFFQDSLLNISSLSELEEVIRKNFYSLGLESYSLFIKDHIGGDYYPAYFENDDLLGFSNSGFKIKRDNRLITFLINKKSSIILENFNESSVIIDTFGRNRSAKMELFIAYPFIISGKLSGFITIFKINPAVNIIDIDIRIQKINRFIFTYLHRIFELDPEINKYIDPAAMFYERIESEIKHAQELNIPLSLVLLTIKNYKRFYDRFGKIELDKLSDSTADLIKSRLSAGDFSAKVDRNKFLVVLPGKEKRFSIMFSNAVKNEIIEKNNISDFKILVTSLNSVFPEDGKDLFSILEVLE